MHLTRPSTQSEFCIHLHDKSLNHSGLPEWFSWFGVVSWSGWSGCSGGPGGPGGPGGQGCLGGQGGPGDQVCQCIWFTWSKQSNYRKNLICHACDTLTH